MDPRRERRVETDQGVRVTLLGNEESSLLACLQDVSGRGMRLRLERSLPLNAPVKVDYDGSLFLGQVCYVQRQGSAYVVGLELDQVIRINPGLGTEVISGREGGEHLKLTVMNYPVFAAPKNTAS